MASFTLPFPLDRDSRRRGQDPQELEAVFGRVLTYIYHALPNPPVTADGDLCILFDDDGGGVDRLSLLPDTLLGNIVSRLPIKEAARTAVLARRWRPIWRATPLVLLDTHLLPGGDDVIPNHLDRASSSAVVAAVSRILDTHPGPFSYVSLTCCYMDEHRAPFARWLKLFAVKGVKELFLINRPWPLETKTPIPATLFSMADLTTLYLGFWKFPDTAGLLRGAAFPRLRELCLCTVYVDTRDIEFVLSKSPVLEILNFEGLILPIRLRLVSNSLRCLQIHGCKLDSLTVVDAPRLERLFLQTYESEGLKNRIKIAHAPALLLFGNFDLGKDELQIGRTIIKARTGMDPSATITSVKTLDVDVRFGVRSDAKMLLIILRCFPNLERLHIHSKNTTQSTGRLNIKFWQEESGAIKCVLSRITVMTFCDFRGERNEIAFLKFVIETAPMLRTLLIAYANGYFGSSDEATSKTKALFAGKRANDRCLLAVFENEQADCGLWNFQNGSDFSCHDPFGVFQCSSIGVGRWYV